jgi:hypothetical protein
MQANSFASASFFCEVLGYCTDTEKSPGEKSGHAKTDPAMRPNMTNRSRLNHAQILLQIITHEQQQTFDSRHVAKKALALAFSGITSICRQVDIMFEAHIKDAGILPF